MLLFSWAAVHRVASQLSPAVLKERPQQVSHYRAHRFPLAHTRGWHTILVETGYRLTNVVLSLVVFSLMEDELENIATATSSPRRPSFVVLCQQERRRWDTALSLTDVDTPWRRDGVRERKCLNQQLTRRATGKRERFLQWLWLEHTHGTPPATQPNFLVITRTTHTRGGFSLYITTCVIFNRLVIHPPS